MKKNTFKNRRKKNRDCVIKRQKNNQGEKTEQRKYFFFFLLHNYIVLQQLTQLVPSPLEKHFSLQDPILNIVIKTRLNGLRFYKRKCLGGRKEYTADLWKT